MAEEMKPAFNPDFMVDPKKHKALLKLAQEIFENPSKIASIDICEVAPDSPALASKLFLAAYTRALKEEARKAGEKDESIFEEINAKYSAFVSEYLLKNQNALERLSKSKTNKNGGKSLWQWKNLKKT